MRQGNLRRGQMLLCFGAFVGLLGIAGCGGLDRSSKERRRDCDIVRLQIQPAEQYETPVDLAAEAGNEAMDEASCIQQTREESGEQAPVFVEVKFIRGDGAQLIERGIVEYPRPPARFPCLVVAPEGECAESPLTASFMAEVFHLQLSSP